MVYFIDRYESKLVKLDTSNLIADAYDLPFQISDDRVARRTSIAAMNDKVFIFGNGKVYMLYNNSIDVIKDISYTFNSQIADYSSDWCEIWTCSALKGDGIIYLIINTYDWNIPKPQRTDYDILEFNPNNYQFSKRIIETSEDEKIGFSDIIYIGNNKALMINTNSTAFQKNYFHYLKMINLTNGDINYLGNLKLTNIFRPSLLAVNNSYYVIGENLEYRNYHSDCYNFSLNNTNINLKKVDYIQFIKRENELYISWLLTGNPFDGTWEPSSTKYSKSYMNRKNQFLKIYPSKGNITNFSDSYLSKYQINTSSNYLTFPNYGKIFSLKSDFTVNSLVQEVQYQGSIVSNIFNTDIKAVFADWSNNIFLFGDNFT